VLTSARLIARAPHGFATYIRQLRNDHPVTTAIPGFQLS
jgi:hypothetical protein